MACSCSGSPTSTTLAPASAAWLSTRSICREPTRPASSITSTSRLVSCLRPCPHTAHHSAYRLGFARIAYPWHPLYGRRLRVGQRTTRRAADLLLVEERIGV